MNNKENIVPFGTPDETEIKLINKYTRREYKADEVYTFSVVLCDNDIDRDFEQFSPDAIEKLAQMFVGKTGICDHNPKASNQVARIYECHAEAVEGESNLVGEPLVRLKAKAYIPKDGNEELINSIDSGIKKEVSIGCSASKRYCSICGCDAPFGECNHIKGKKYDKTLCYPIIEEPYDAYEWSFVAVPAQRSAGVIKSFSYGGKKDMQEIMKSLAKGEQMSLTADEARRLHDSIKSMENSYKLAEEYKKELVTRAVKAAACVNDELSMIVGKTAEKLDISELKNLCECFEKKAKGEIKPVPQLYKNKAKKNILDNSKYSI